MAMHESTDNAKELLEDLVIKRNKIRQENITEEIIDIISAVNAMKG
jgi:F-type H+-transporting ATPase subunit gamma